MREETEALDLLMYFSYLASPNRALEYYNEIFKYLTTCQKSFKDINDISHCLSYLNALSFSYSSMLKSRLFHSSLSAIRLR